MICIGMRTTKLWEGRRGSKASDNESFTITCGKQVVKRKDYQRLIDEETRLSGRVSLVATSRVDWKSSADVSVIWTKELPRGATLEVAVDKARDLPAVDGFETRPNNRIKEVRKSILVSTKRCACSAAAVILDVLVPAYLAFVPGLPIRIKQEAWRGLDNLAASKSTRPLLTM